eukprot:TRINITY_DN7532_c0_g2_i4.p1 TRINITY_DN7532_c0_g2~~TRINITY_DN7532_c0_g2_i4.p1  ORF type:complete len:954 (+),score=102.05 TRINITY_DN7532_c0_g2_i4:68-2863(+)
MFSAVRSGARRVQHSLTTPVERGRRVTAMGLAASGAVYLYVLTRCGYHTIVHADTGSGDLWNSGVIPAGIAGSVLMVTTVWAVLFTGMAVSSGFSWGHVHHARDNAFLLYHYPCDAKRRAAILEWIHFADLTAQNQHDYHDLYTDTRRRPPVRFVPDPREFKDMDLQETSITGEELVTCPEGEKRMASRSFVPEFYCAGKTDDWSEKDICYWALCDRAAAGVQQKIDTLRGAYMHSPRERKAAELRNQVALALESNRGGLEKLRPGDRIGVGAAFFGTNRRWMPANLVGTCVGYGQSHLEDIRGTVKVVWDDPELDHEQEQRLHPIHWKYLVQLGLYEVARPGWALRCKCRGPARYNQYAGGFVDPGDLISHERRPEVWRSRRSHCRNSDLAAGGVQYEIVRKLGRPDGWWVSHWSTASLLWFLACVATTFCVYWRVWVVHLKAAPTVIGGAVENPVDASEHRKMPIAQLVMDPAAMCASFDIVATPMLTGTLKIVLFQMAASTVFGQFNSGQTEECWLVSLKRAWGVRQDGSPRAASLARESQGCCTGWGDKLSPVAKICFAVYNVVGFVLALARGLSPVLFGKRSVSSWDNYETFLVLTVINPATLSLVQLLLRLRASAASHSLQRQLYIGGLCIFSVFGAAAFCTHIGLAVLVVAGALVLVPLIVPIVAALSYFCPGVHHNFATTASDTLGVLSVVGVLVVSAGLATAAYAVVYPSLKLCIALAAGAWNWCGCGSSVGDFAETREAARKSLGQRARKPKYPRDIRVKVYDSAGEIPLDDPLTESRDKIREQFKWYENRRLNGLVAEHTGEFTGTYAVWTFEDGQRHWFDGSFLKVAKPAGSFRGRLRMVMASVLRNLPEAVALVVQANIARFVLQSLTLYMVLWYAGIPLSKVPEAEFNARNVEVYARCVLMDVFQSWGHVQQVLSWL